jgi:16S rRNA (guanine527-N7)-methyltransferase
MDEAVLGALAEARALGFLGPGPLDAHLASADVFAAALGPLSGRALDLGSGGGVPGLLLAARYDGVRWTLLDKHRRRTSFLARVVATLGWVGRVDVVRADAEVASHDPQHRGQFEAVVSRSFGRPAVTAEVARGFLGDGGRLVVSEPPRLDPARWPAAGVAALAFESVAWSADVAVFRALGPPPDGVPRAWRQLERTPLWS